MVCPAGRAVFFRPQGTGRHASIQGGMELRGHIVFLPGRGTNQVHMRVNQSRTHMQPGSVDHPFGFMGMRINLFLHPEDKAALQQ